MTGIFPPGLIYAGLAGCLLAMIIATARNKWSPKTFFLLALRLAIGWHFMFEGLNKIQSYMVGPTDSNKPFTSEPYFALADGPLGPIVRKQIGDQSEMINNRLRKSATANIPAPGTKNPDSYVKIVPGEIVADWDKYCAEFSNKYLAGTPVDEKLKTEILATYGQWIAGEVVSKDTKIRYFQSDVSYSVPQRLEHLAKVEQQIAELKDRIKPGFGQGFGYDQTRMTAAKGELRTVRTDLIADSEAEFLNMKRLLFSETKGKQLKQIQMPSVVFADEAKFKELLAFELPTDKPVTFENNVPKVLKDVWTQFSKTTTDTLALKDEKFKSFGDAGEFSMQAAADWFAKKWPTAKAEPKEKLLAELDKQFAQYRTLSNNVIDSDTAAGLIVNKAVKKIESMDKFTMWFIAIVGACIFFGFMTPIACLSAVGFLVITYLTHPPFPWLPLPPNTEGNPLFVNKNAIEALALLVVACHPTGRWLGLDALWTWLLGIRKKV